MVKGLRKPVGNPEENEVSVMREAHNCEQEAVPRETEVGAEAEPGASALWLCRLHSSPAAPGLL